MSTQKTWSSHSAWIRWAVYCTFVFLFLILAAIAAAPGTPAKQPAQQAKAAEENTLKRQFSAWDGSHVETVRAIKASLNDPESFRHGETVYFQRKDGSLKVLTTFYAKNGFGGTIKTVAESITDAQGNVLKLQFLK